MTLQDFRGQGPPADIGTFQLPCSVLVFQHVFSGTTYFCAVRSGAQGWVLIDYGANPATVTNSALSEATAHDVTLLLRENWTITATLSVPVGVHLKGVGWRYSLNYNAGGNCITIAGDNAKVSDLKIVVVAGAGGAGTRPNCIYAANRTNLEVRSVWLVGDSTVGDDGSEVRQCSIAFETVTYSGVHDCRMESNRRHGITLQTASDSNTVSGNTCNGNIQHGITVLSSSSNTVFGNTCIGNIYSGILLYVAYNNTVSGNTCNGNAWGIAVQDSSSNTVSGNTCNGNTRHGITVISSSSNTVSGNTCNDNDVNNTGTYDGINLVNGSSGNIVSHNTCKNNDRWGVMVDNDSDYNKVHGNYTGGNTSGSIRVNSADCNSNQIEWNTVEEGAPSDAGTTTRSYGNYDPSANAFVGDVGAAPF